MIGTKTRSGIIAKNMEFVSYDIRSIIAKRKNVEVGDCKIFGQLCFMYRYQLPSE